MLAHGSVGWRLGDASGRAEHAERPGASTQKENVGGCFFFVSVPFMTCYREGRWVLVNLLKLILLVRSCSIRAFQESKHSSKLEFLAR